ncbi:glutathione S-transferase 1: isoform D-like protein [Leptotrombidium deliense]|uniref:Glutathione S-transferase 1: isoform D-like protein n=1 Tax=Leptotrombidium deliense TaxID=299467 RepID=A0A443SCA1_9ACAR|nr:glutathione S-transferase 1: isoform D-like protein [Leptotrombidium deliense]
MPIDFYYINDSPNCRVVSMVAEYLKIPLNLKLVDLWQSCDHLKPEFEKLNPQKCVPTIVDDGFSLGESRAIIRYLANQYAPDNEIYPKCAKKRAIVDQLLEFDHGSLYKTLNEWCAPYFMEKKPLDAELEKKFTKHLTVLNDHFLKKHKYVAADHLTLADFSILSTISGSLCFGYDLYKYENIKAWLDRLERELPFYDKAVNEFVSSMKKWIQENIKSE